MVEMSGLFAPNDLPRAARLKRMHVRDAGCDNGLVRLVCPHCGYDDGWSRHPRRSVSELKRGLPCPECNADRTR